MDGKSIIFAVLLGCVCVSFATPFGDTPNWESNDLSASHRVILADFNGDGWQAETGEQNTGDGYAKCFYLEHYPAREITEIRVAGTPLSLADYCCDPHNGWFSLATAPGNGVTVEVDYVWSNRLDMFVSNEYRDQVSGNDLIYFNTGSELNVNAGWQSDLDDLSMYCVSGDIDLDGDIDLIVDGTPDWYTPDSIHVYYNDNGNLETTPSLVIEVDATSCFALGDVDSDGYPELVYGDYNNGDPHFYMLDNVNGVFNETPIWSIPDEWPFSTALGDYDGDGDLDLAAASYCNLVQGEGYTYIYRNNNGTLEQTRCWQNDPPQGDCSGLTWGDINGDGLLDLYKGICGGGVDDDWYADSYFNTGNGLPTSPSWESTYYTYVFTTSTADYDGDGLQDIVNAKLSGAIGYFHMPSGTLEDYPSWIYVAGAPYTITGSAVGDINNDGLFDIALACCKSTGYPDGGPNKVFYNDGSGVGIDDEETPNTPAGFALYQSYPNPAGNSATISFALPETAIVNLSVYDIKGRKIATLADEKMNAGEYERTVSDLATGLYLYRLQADEYSAVKKMVVK